MKKLILTLSLLTLLFSLCITVQADFDENGAMLLKALDIIDVKPEDADTIITRGEFAEYMIRFMGIQSADTKEYLFEDVSEYTSSADAIYTLKTLNILAGAGDGNFYPDSPITENQAAIVVTRALGYGAVSKSIEFDAAKLGIGSMTDNPLTLGGAVSLLFRALECECVTEKFTGAETDYEFKENYLSEIFGVYAGNDILMQNSLTTLDGNGEVADNSTLIGDHKLRNDGYNVDSLLGMNVDYYYISKKRSSAGADTLICAYPSDTNKVYEIDERDIVSFDGKTLKYSEGDRERSVVIDAVADIIYNGIACPQFELSSLFSEDSMSSFGITYIDNGSKSRCLKIEEYKNAIVASVTEDSIYFKNRDAKSVVFDKYDEGRLIITDAKGNAVESVASEMVMSIYESADGEYLRLICSTNVADGVKITETDEESITANGVRYLIFQGYSNWKNALGNIGDTTYKIYIDAYGEVMKISKSSEGLSFGYIISSYTASFNKIFLAILVEDGEIESIECAPKLSINGIKKEYTEQLIKNELEFGNKPFAQLITYKTNKDGQITTINTASNALAKDEEFKETVANKTDDSFRIVYASQNDGNKVYKNATKIFGTDCPVDEMTKMFFVPEEPDGEFKLGNDENYWTGNISSIDDDSQAKGYGYSTTAQFGNAEAMVVYDFNTKSSIGKRLAVIKKVTKVINDESDERTRVTFIINGKLVAYNLSADIENKYGKYLSEGDLVRFGIDRNYEVSGLQLYCDSKKDENGKRILTCYDGTENLNVKPFGFSTKTNTNDTDRIVSGSVFDYAEGLMCIVRDEAKDFAPSDEPEFEYFRGINGVFVCVVDDEEITAGTDADIVSYVNSNADDCSKVFLTTKFGAVQEVVVYK